MSVQPALEVELKGESNDSDPPEVDVAERYPGSVLEICEQVLPLEYRDAVEQVIAVYVRVDDEEIKGHLQGMRSCVHYPFEKLRVDDLDRTVQKALRTEKLNFLVINSKMKLSVGYYLYQNRINAYMFPINLREKVRNAVDPNY